MRTLTTAAISLAMAFSVLLASGGVASANALAGGGYSSSYAGESVFEGKAAGESGQFSAIFFNDGTQSWAPGVIGLLICLADKVTCNVASPNSTYASGWYSSTVYATVSSSVAPGQNGFFVYNFTVPAGTTAGTVATFNGDVGIIATGMELRPEGYYQTNTTPASAGTLTISPTSVSLAVGGQQQFTATSSLTGTITWSTTGGCGAVTATGLFVSTAMNSASQPCTVVATSGSLTASASITVYGAVSSLSCAANPTSVVAGGGTNGTSTVTVTLKDTNGNTVLASTPAVTITNATPTYGTISPSGALTPSSGVVTTTLTSTLTTGTIIISAASTSGIAGCNVQITNGLAGAPAKTASSFLLSPIGADSTSTTTLRIDIEDTNGNRVTTDNNTTVDVSLTAGANVCTLTGVTTGSGSASGGSATATDSQGRIEITTKSTAVPGTCTFTITPRNTAIASSTASLTTQFIGSATQLDVSANDSPHPAGSASTTTITVVVKDAVGNQVTSFSSNITAAPDTSSCTGAGGGSVTATSATVAASSGSATFTFTSNGAYSNCLVTFSSSGLSSATATIVFTPGTADHLGCAFSVNPMSTSGTTAGLVYVRDSTNNNLGSYAGVYSVNFSRTSGDGVTSSTTTNPQSTTNGVATFIVTSTSTPGTDTYTPSLASGSTTLTGTNTTCSIISQ